MEETQESQFQQTEYQSQNKQQEKKVKELKIFENLLQKKLGIHHPILKEKHEYCKHKHGCLSHLFDLSVSGFCVGYSAKCVVHLALTLLRNFAQFKQSPLKTIFSILINKDNIRFGFFPFFQLLLMQGSQCILRKLRNKEDGTNAFVSGFFSGFSLLMVKKDMRQIWAMYLFVRSLELCYNHLVNKKVLPKSQMNWIIIFSLLWSWQAYNMCFETGNNSDTFNKFANKNMYEDIADITVRKAWIAKKKSGNVHERIQTLQHRQQYLYFKTKSLSENQIILLNNEYSNDMDQIIFLQILFLNDPISDTYLD